MRKLTVVLREVLGTIVFSLLLVPFVAEVAWQINLPGLSLKLVTLAPTFMYDDEQVLRRAQTSDAEKLLSHKGKVMKIGEFGLKLPGEYRLPIEFQQLATLSQAMTATFDHPPPHIPEIEFISLDGMEGSCNFSRFIISPSVPAPFRTFVHEVTHLFLFWNLFPGMPMDCPRWFNEGMAEYISGKLSPSTDLEVIPPQSVIPLWALSSAYSKGGGYVDFQGKKIYACLEKSLGPDQVMELIRGLRCARPFRSVFIHCQKKNWESFSQDLWLQFRREYDLSFLTKEEALRRLKNYDIYDRWLSEAFSVVQNRWPDEKEFKTLEIESLRKSLSKLIAAGNILHALGLLRSHRAKFSPEELREIRSSSKAAFSAAEPASSTVMEFARKRSLLGYLIIFSFSWMLFQGYKSLRAKICEINFGKSCYFFPVFLIFVWICAWLIRLLVVGMLPYSGYWALSDFHRILLAEALVALFLTGMAKSLSHLAGLSRSISEPIESSKLIFAAVAVGFLPVLIELFRGTLVLSPIGKGEMLLVFLANCAQVLSTGILLGTFFTFSRGSYFVPAAAYALFRGGLCFHPTGTLLLLSQGWFLAGLTERRESSRTWFLVDYFLLFPHFFIVPAWFVAVDPVGGIFWRTSQMALLWLLPTVVLWGLCLKMKKT